MIRALRIGGLAALLAAAPLTAMAEPAALIVAAQGDIAPPVEEFSEAEAGARYDLGASAEIILMHYAGCTESHFRGGVVTVEALGFETTGETVSATQVECPTKVAFKGGSDAVAAVVLRSDGGRQAQLNVRPVFVALGDDIKRIEVRRDGKVVASLKATSRLLRWPKSTAPLQAGAAYELVVVTSAGQRVAAAGAAPAAGVTVIQP